MLWTVQLTPLVHSTDHIKPREHLEDPGVDAAVTTTSTLGGPWRSKLAGGVHLRAFVHI